MHKMEPRFSMLSSIVHKYRTFWPRTLSEEKNMTANNTIGGYKY